MKRYNELFGKISDIENLRIAHQNARKGKQHYREVRIIDKNPDIYLKNIQYLLYTKTFTTSEYEIFNKKCGKKERVIYKLPYFPDRIVQHSLMQIIEPIFISTFIRDTFQSIKGRGTHDARKRVQKALKENEPLYALKFDIEKFYPSVNNEKLKHMIRSKIKCNDTLWLIDDIIDSTYGLPIGNYSSQIFGNVYLNSFDHYCKEHLRLKNYFRYCDDIVILHEDKKYLHDIKNIIFEKLNNEYFLNIKNNWQIFPVEKQGLDFLGWVFTKNCTTLRKSTATNFKDKTRYIKRNHHKNLNICPISSIMSYWGIIKPADSKRLWKTYVDSELKNKTDKYSKGNENPIRNKGK